MDSPTARQRSRERRRESGRSSFSSLSPVRPRLGTHPDSGNSAPEQTVPPEPDGEPPGGVACEHKTKSSQLGVSGTSTEHVSSSQEEVKE